MTASDVARRPDFPLSATIPAARRPFCRLYSDTLNAEHTSLRSSDISPNSFPPEQPQDNLHNMLPSDSRRPSVAEGQVPRSSETDRSRTWKELAQVLDRLFFWVMLVAMTSSGTNSRSSVLLRDVGRDDFFRFFWHEFLTVCSSV